jgi:hypothetical protein
MSLLIVPNALATLALEQVDRFPGGSSVPTLAHHSSECPLCADSVEKVENTANAKFPQKLARF